MSPEQIIAVVSMYEKRLVEANIPKERMAENRTFESLSLAERLAHAHYLIDGVKQLAITPGKERKTGSHLTSIQMCLSFSGWYTLKELKDHNR